MYTLCMETACICMYMYIAWRLHYLLCHFGLAIGMAEINTGHFHGRGWEWYMYVCTCKTMDMHVCVLLISCGVRYSDNTLLLQCCSIVYLSQQKFIAHLYKVWCCSLPLCSSFDEYAMEVKSGRLEWSPVHRSDKFWVSFFTTIPPHLCIGNIAVL